MASLPQAQGGGGGIWIEVGGEVGQVRISVETKKDKADRPAGRGRGGAVGGTSANGGPENRGGGGGGSFRGRGGGARAGRGGGSGGGGGASGQK